MKLNRRPLLAIIPAVALAGSMLTAPVAGAQSSLPIPEDLIGSASGSLNLGSLGGDPCGEKIVTPGNMGGWSTPDDENKATIVATTDDGFGTGVLETKPHAKGTSLYKAAGNVPASSLLNDKGEAKPISFQYKGEGQAPALQIRVLGANVVGKADDGAGPFEKTKDGFATIAWSPKDGTTQWQKADANDSQFWVSRAIVKDPNDLDADGKVKGGDNLLLKRGERKSLKDIVKILGEKAVISEYGVQQTKDNETETIQVDDFVFGCETTDFEKEAPKEDAPTVPDFGSLALGGGLALAAALAVGGGAWAIQNGMIQLPPELAALLPA